MIMNYLHCCSHWTFNLPLPVSSAFCPYIPLPHILNTMKNCSLFSVTDVANHCLHSYHVIQHEYNIYCPTHCLTSPQMFSMALRSRWHVGTQRTMSMSIQYIIKHIPLVSQFMRKFHLKCVTTEWYFVLQWLVSPMSSFLDEGWHFSLWMLS
jgi:hypothetical protein